jgi:hypothetical protein
MDIKTKNGLISAYGLSCGYVESRETDYVSLELWKEHNTYHVRHINYHYFRTEWNDSPHYVWLSFELLKDAREKFFELCDKLNLRRIK